MDASCPKFAELVRELDERAPGAPLLALGQTVFWDEPMKALVAQVFQRFGSARRYIAGVHDTDYFAKFPGGKGGGRFTMLPHNDTTTKGLWSAAGEFSCIFGSETVVTKDRLAHAGGKVHRIESQRPGFLDDITEAWGWRGVVSRSKDSKITAEKRLPDLFPYLYDAFQWAIDESLDLISGQHHADSQRMKDRLLSLVCEMSERDGVETLSDLYEALLPEFYSAVAAEKVELETTRTTRLLAFNRETAHLPRFEVVDLFVNPQTRREAENCYNDAVAGSEIYTLDRFGTGALPFDLVIPGVGRGTLRLGTRGGVVMTSTPQGFSFKKPLQSVQELAAVIEDRFGPGCVLVGKAVSLILMLAREHVFVFHAGASSYVHRSARLAKCFQEIKPGITWHPILRVKLEPWDAMDECCAWLKLPEPLERPFGTKELSAPSFARRWKEVASEQLKILEALPDIKRPVDLVTFLQKHLGGTWECLANEYQQMNSTLGGFQDQLAALKREKESVLAELRSLKQERVRVEIARGEQWRAEIFEQTPTEGALARREASAQALAEIESRRQQARRRFRDLDTDQRALVESEQMDRLRRRRDAIALEAEMMRMHLIREAVVATDGLAKAGHRPSAWWFALVCPDGTWFRATAKGAMAWLEPLV